MKVGLLAPQGWKHEYDGWDPRAAWERTLELAAHAEARGFEALWVFDHFTTVPDPTEEITFESFSMLAALAMVTKQVRLGHMVICTGFRNPGLTAKLASTIDVISNGRFELGIGAGWKEDEWLAYGFGFPDVGERVGTLGDHLEVITRMLAPGRATYHGTYASVEGAINVPKGIQPHIPVIIGGNGRDRIAGYAIKYGDELNLVYRDAAFAVERMREVRERCEREGRHPSTLRFSMYVGDDDLREPGKPRIEILRAFAATGLDRLACFPGRWDTSIEGQERFAQDCEAAGIVLDGP